MCGVKENGNKRSGLSFFTAEERETEALGAELAELLRPGDVIAFYGDLGAGKTAFVRGLARALQAQETVSSPTFVLMHIYEGRIPIYHFDAYRLQSAEELINIGAEEYIGTDGIACVEWSERVEKILPEDRLCVSISYETEKLGPCGRKLKFEAVCGRGLEIVEALKGDSSKDKDI